MAKRKPKAGDRYRSVAGAAPPGFEVTVREVVPADVAGANAFLPDAPLDELTAERARERVELAELVAQHAREVAEAGGDEALAGLAERHSDEVAALRAAHGRAAVEREAPWQADAVVVTWQMPGVVIDESVEPRLEPYTDDQGRERTRSIRAQTYGTVNRAVSVALSEFHNQYKEV